MNEWNDITEISPPDANFGVDDAKQYLVYVDIPNYGGNIQIATWMNSRWVGFPQGDSDITHWMDLPNIPSEISFSNWLNRRGV